MTDWKNLPLIPRDKKKTVKIKTKDIKKIKQLFTVKKLTMVAIAKLYGVHPITIKRNLNPEFRKRNQGVTSRWQKNAYKNKNYRKKIAIHKANYYQRKKKLRDKIGKENVIENRKLVTKKNNNYDFYA